ncbi:MAG: hypothetical protein AAFZ11_14015, partial [Pseudomonadota bacterium]
MFKPHPSIKPMILLAASAGIMSASNVAAAPVTHTGPSLLQDARSFAQPKPGERRTQRTKRVSPTGERAQTLQQGQGERTAQRTEIYERAATVEASEIQA